MEGGNETDFFKIRFDSKKRTVAWISYGEIRDDVVDTLGSDAKHQRYRLEIGACGGDGVGPAACFHFPRKRFAKEPIATPCSFCG